jgi:ribosomal protein S18 acetylase RimI-like enzyme
MLQIRQMRSADVEPLAVLFEETQAHYKVPCPPRATILRDLGALPPGVDILVAEDARLIGYACLAAVYPGPGLTSGFFLKELFVSKSYRNRGVGRDLMRACAALALERGYQRLDFTADRDNAALVAFYERLGATLKREKAFFRFDAAVLRELSAGEREL